MQEHFLVVLFIVWYVWICCQLLCVWTKFHSVTILIKARAVRSCGTANYAAQGALDFEYVGEIFICDHSNKWHKLTQYFPVVLLIITSETVKEILKFKQYSCAFFECSVMVNNKENLSWLLKYLQEDMQWAWCCLVDSSDLKYTSLGIPAPFYHRSSSQCN